LQIDADPDDEAMAAESAAMSAARTIRVADGCVDEE
jgi:hypothetical protein